MKDKKKLLENINDKISGVSQAMDGVSEIAGKSGIIAETVSGAVDGLTKGVPKVAITANSIAKQSRAIKRNEKKIKRLEKEIKKDLEHLGQKVYNVYISKKRLQKRDVSIYADVITKRKQQIAENEEEIKQLKKQEISIPK